MYIRSMIIIKTIFIDGAHYDDIQIVNFSDVGKALLLPILSTCGPVAIVMWVPNLNFETVF